MKLTKGVVRCVLPGGAWRSLQRLVHAGKEANWLQVAAPRHRAGCLYDKVRLGAEIRKEAKLIHQERAYSSPIWYTPDQKVASTVQGKHASPMPQQK